MLCNNSSELYWGRDLWHIHTLLSLDASSKERIIMKRQRFIEGNKNNGEKSFESSYPSDDVCNTTTNQLFETHMNSLVIFKITLSLVVLTFVLYSTDCKNIL